MSLLVERPEDDVMADINVTPLVDVMLVLLVIFIITIPVIQHAVKLDLPRASAQPHDVKPTHVSLAIAADGSVSWDGRPIDAAALKERIAEASRHSPQPEIHLRADRSTPFEKVAQVMAAAQTGGLSRLGFVTDPSQAQR